MAKSNKKVEKKTENKTEKVAVMDLLSRSVSAAFGGSQKKEEKKVEEKKEVEEKKAEKKLEDIDDAALKEFEEKEQKAVIPNEGSFVSVEAGWPAERQKASEKQKTKTTPKKAKKEKKDDTIIPSPMVATKSAPVVRDSEVELGGGAVETAVEQGNDGDTPIIGPVPKIKVSTPKKSEARPPTPKAALSPPPAAECPPSQPVYVSVQRSPAPEPRHAAAVATPVRHSRHAAAAAITVSAPVAPHGLQAHASHAHAAAGQAATGHHNTNRHAGHSHSAKKGSIEEVEGSVKMNLKYVYEQIGEVLRENKQLRNQMKMMEMQNHNLTASLEQVTEERDNLKQQLIFSKVRMTCSNEDFASKLEEIGLGVDDVEKLRKSAASLLGESNVEQKAGVNNNNNKLHPNAGATGRSDSSADCDNAKAGAKVSLWGALFPGALGAAAAVETTAPAVSGEKKVMVNNNASSAYSKLNGPKGIKYEQPAHLRLPGGEAVNGSTRGRVLSGEVSKVDGSQTSGSQSITTAAGSENGSTTVNGATSTSMTQHGGSGSYNEMGQRVDGNGNARAGRVGSHNMDRKNSHTQRQQFFPSGRDLQHMEHKPSRSVDMSAAMSRSGGQAAAQGLAASHSYEMDHTAAAHAAAAAHHAAASHDMYAYSHGHAAHEQHSHSYFGNGAADAGAHGGMSTAARIEHLYGQSEANMMAHLSSAASASDFESQQQFVHMQHGGQGQGLGGMRSAGMPGTMQEHASSQNQNAQQNNRGYNGHNRSAPLTMPVRSGSRDYSDSMERQALHERREGSGNMERQARPMGDSHPGLAALRAHAGVAAPQVNNNNMGAQSMPLRTGADVYAAISPKNVGTESGPISGSSASSAGHNIYAAMNGAATLKKQESMNNMSGNFNINGPMDAASEARGVTIINTNVRPADLAHYKVRLLELCRKHGVDLRTIEWFCLPENAIFWETLARKLEEIDRRSTMGDGHFKVKNPSAWLTKFFNTIKKQNAGLLASVNLNLNSVNVNGNGSLAPQSSAVSSSAVSSSATGGPGSMGGPASDVSAANQRGLEAMGRSPLTERDLALLSSGNPAAGSNPAATVSAPINAAAALRAAKQLVAQESMSFSDAGVPMVSVEGVSVPPGLGHQTAGRQELPTMSPEEARRMVEGM